VASVQPAGRVLRAAIALAARRHGFRCRYACMRASS
jgi:hypothetical protein